MTTRESEEAKKRKRLNQNKDAEDDKDMDDLKEVVFVATAADTVKMVEVSSGIQDDTYIQILTGLNAGDEIVILK